MKLRQGFVSNSSTTSFTCDACGETLSGWDLSSIDCEGGHEFCEECASISIWDKSPIELKKLFSIILKKEAWDDEFEEYSAILTMSDEEFKIQHEAGLFDELINKIEDYDNKEIPSELCPICSMKIIADSDLVNYLVKTTGISKATVFSKIKEANKRRKKLYDHEYITAVLIYISKSREEVEKEIKERFTDYNKFYEFING